MRTTLIYIFFVITLITSCKKDTPTVNTGSTNTTDTTSVIIDTTNTPEDVCGISWNTSVNYGSVKDIDGNTYNTVVIGSQEWMAENLKTTKYNNGDTLVAGRVSSADHQYMWALDGNGESLADCYGYLYNGFVVLDTSRNICPTGWHIPIVSEYDTLEVFTEQFTHSAEYNLKSKNGWGFGSGDDIIGFRMLPSGYSNGAHHEVVDVGVNGSSILWTYRENSSGGVILFQKNTEGTWFTEGGYFSDFGAIRCVKD